jgi:3-oxoacyl-[acyl-carrier protein] reductase
MPKTPDYFAGKTIIITGAASGIGRATALIFAREKANVVCADIDENGVKETAERINAIGSQALALTIDVTKRAAVADMVQLAIDGFGSVQFLFNSAGAAIRRARFLEIDDDLFDRTFDLNVKGTLYPMQAVLSHMLANKFGVIVNMGSMSHRRGGPGSSVHYAAAKGAVVTMTMGVAREFATQGIRALSISPGPVRTPFQAAASSSPDLVQRFLDDVPMKRFAEPEEIGELVLFMCSDACEFMTADTVYVNGGGGWRSKPGNRAVTVRANARTASVAIVRRPGPPARAWRSRVPVSPPFWRSPSGRPPAPLPSRSPAPAAGADAAARGTRRIRRRGLSPHARRRSCVRES